MVFARANANEASTILKCLSIYSTWSGQSINPSKSPIFFSRNCRLASKVAVNNILHLAPTPARAQYLGIPLFLNRSKKDTFSALKDKIFGKISGWKARLLSQTARTTLVKSVANAIPSYILSIFLLPKAFCLEVKPQDKKKNLSFLSWASICQPKALGGLGICFMESVNNSLLARLGWKMTINAPLLWVDALRGKYLRNGSTFLNDVAHPMSSWLWKGIMKNKSVVQKGACLSITNGMNVDIWSSPWIPTMPSFKPRPNPSLVGLPEFCVADLMLPGSRCWNSSLLGDLFDSDSVQSILSIHIPTIRSFDKWIWAPSSSGTLSVRSAQEISSSPGTRSPPFGPETWHALWSLKLQARLKHLLWKVAWNMLPSRDNISRFVVSEDPNTWNCPFRNRTLETLNHFLGM
jgi:hypothetical protein